MRSKQSRHVSRRRIIKAPNIFFFVSPSLPEEDFDFGSFLMPSATSKDFGTFPTPSIESVDFGSL